MIADKHCESFLYALHPSWLVMAAAIKGPFQAELVIPNSANSRSFACEATRMAMNGIASQPLQPFEVDELSIPASSFRSSLTNSSSAEWRHSSEARNINAIPSTPESPYSNEGAPRSSPCDVVHAWSDRNGSLGGLGLPKRPAFKRASGNMASFALSPVLSVGSVGSTASTPRQSPLFSMTTPTGERKRRPSAERQPMGLGGWSPLQSTPEGSRCEVSATPLQASVMMQDRMSREQAPEESEVHLAKLASLLEAPGPVPAKGLWSPAAGGRVVNLERRSAGFTGSSRPLLSGAVPVQRRSGASFSVPLTNAKLVPQGAATTASPWTCFVEGVHALLGCKLQD